MTKSYLNSSLRAPNTVRLLLCQLYITLFLDGINELSVHFGLGVPLGQIVRGVFIVFDIIIVFCLGSKKMVQVMVLCLAFFAIETLREVFFGASGVLYAGIYWSKVVSCILVFLAIKASYEAGYFQRDKLDSFFKLAIYIVPLIFLFFAAIGIITQNHIDAGVYGKILSKNALTAVLLILFALSLKYGFERLVFLVWAIVSLACLVLLGSKAALAFAALILVSALVSRMVRKGTRKSFLPLLLLIVISITILYIIFSNRINEIIFNQIDQLNYTTQVRNQSILQYLLSGRNTLLAAGFESFKQGFTFFSVFIGNGIYSIAHDVAAFVGSGGAYRGIEMDVFEIFFGAGIIGLVFIFLPVVQGIKALRLHKTSDRYYLIVVLIIILLFSVFGGHVYTEGMAAEYFGIFLGYLVMKETPPRKRSLGFFSSKISRGKHVRAPRHTLRDESFLKYA